MRLSALPAGDVPPEAAADLADRSAVQAGQQDHAARGGRCLLKPEGRFPRRRRSAGRHRRRPRRRRSALTAQAGAMPATKNGEWPMNTADLRGSKYSPLDQIIAANFNKLEVA